jgi:hypothetical protein
MINRYRGICESCQQQFVFRAVVPLATTDSLRFCCPGCNIELSSGLSLDYSVPRMDLKPHGFILDNEHALVNGPVVTVATDLPVHKTLHTNVLMEGGSPFLLLSQKMGPSFIDWRNKVDALQMLRQNQFSHVKQIVDYARAANWGMVRKCLETMLEADAPKDDISTIYKCFRMMGVFYAPLISIPEMAEFLEEYYVFLNDCFNNKKSEYKSLLEEWSNLPLYRSLRTKALSTFIRVLSHFDAFIVGLMYNEMPSTLKVQIDDYRIFRDDYSVVKAVYQDLFELMSQLLIFLGAVINLSARGTPWQYVTGAKSLNAFKKRPAFERFKILSELPKLSGLIGGVSRPMRNSIGHFSADYQPCTGQLQYDDGTSMNYIVFLGELFAAVKSLWFIMIVIEKTDIDMVRLGVEMHKT